MKKLNPLYSSSLLLLASAPLAQAQTATGQSGNLSYVGPTTRIGIGYDSELKGRVELWQALNVTDTSALVGQVWAARHQAAGLQLQYNWLGGSLGDLTNARVHKVFAAIDQNSDQARKLTVGYGQERENFHWAGYISKGIDKDVFLGSRDVVTTTTNTGIDAALGPYTQNILSTATTTSYSKPYDWGLGVRAGQWYQAQNVRFTGGLDYEWAENSNRQISVSLEAEKYFPYTPFSVSVSGGVGKRSGPFVVDTGVHFGQVMLRYDLFSKGKWSTVSQGAGWVGPKVSKKMESVTEMRTEMKTEMRTETREVDVPVQVNVPGTTAPATKRTEARVVVKNEVRALETYFDLGQSSVNKKSQDEISGLAAALRGIGGNCKVVVNIAGNTCPTGSDRNNTPLSQRRADAVKSALQKAGLNNVSYSTSALAGKSPKYPEVKGQTFRNRRADTEAVIACETTENFTVDVPGAVTAARTETRMEKRRETVQVPVQVPVQVAVQVPKETTVSTPVGWVPRALLSSISHPVGVSMYTARTTTTATTTQPRTYTNQCPTPTNDTATVDANSSANMIDVLANDRDPDNNALSIARVTQGANGAVAIVGNKVTYTPRAGFSGTDTFTYTVSDGYCSDRTATVNVTVRASATPGPAPAALQCKAQTYTFKCATGADIDLTGAASGGNGTYKYTLPARGIYGSITDLGNNKFRYEANKTNCFDRETVRYTATDSTGAKCEGDIVLIDPPKRTDGAQ